MVDPPIRSPLTALVMTTLCYPSAVNFHILLHFQPGISPGVLHVTLRTLSLSRLATRLQGTLSQM